MDNTTSEENRRPLAVRNLSLTRKIAIYLSQKSITPNQISIMSVVFAIVGALACFAYSFFGGVYWLALFVVAIQSRLLCNLFDGMVAVEGGKKTPAGELFNDVPDRIADPILIVAAGLATTSEYGMTLAWIAATVAILTAYIRVLGVSMDCPADFRGPMAKQHRMALLTFTSISAIAFYEFHLLPNIAPYLMDICLAVITLGGVLTCWYRLKRIYQYKANQMSATPVQEDSEPLNNEPVSEESSNE